MKIHPRINWKLFAESDFDSGSLTILGAVIHNFSESGEYFGSVVLREVVVSSFSLGIDKDCTNMQVNIDLAKIHQVNKLLNLFLCSVPV